jgi:hypothetical protein
MINAIYWGREPFILPDMDKVKGNFMNILERKMHVFKGPNLPSRPWRACLSETGIVYSHTVYENTFFVRKARSDGYR